MRLASNSENLTRPRLLVLAGQRAADEELLNFLRTRFDIDLACEMDEALTALRSRQYGAVVAATDDYLPLERALVQQQAASLLNVLGQGACVVSAEGRIIWADARMKQADQELRRQVVSCCGGAERRRQGDRTIPCAFEHAGRMYEVICSPAEVAGAGEDAVAAILFDATETEQARQKMQAIYEAGQDLVRLGGASTERMDAGQRLQFIEDQVVHFTRDVLHYDHFAVRIVDERRNKLTLLTCMGLPEEAKDVEVDIDSPDGGIAALVARTGQTYMCPDTERDPHYRRLGLAGAQSLLSAPLRLKDRVIGVFSLESHHKDAFTDEDRQFVEILAGTVALSLDILNLLTVERHTATNEITSAVTSELAGPLNDIRTEASSLIDEYIGHDDMRIKLQRIINKTEGIGRTVKEIAEAPDRGVLPTGGAAAPEKDEIIAGKHVLVVDDEEIIRQTICDVLRRRGAFVDAAADGAEAQQMIEQMQYDLVLSDIKMPRKTGYEVFASAKKKSQSTAVILITGFGYDPNHSIVRANREGLDAVLFKPFKVDQLVDEVRSALS